MKCFKIVYNISKLAALHIQYYSVYVIALSTRTHLNSSFMFWWVTQYWRLTSRPRTKRIVLCAFLWMYIFGNLHYVNEEVVNPHPLQAGEALEPETPNPELQLTLSSLELPERSQRAESRLIEEYTHTHTHTLPVFGYIYVTHT